MGIIVSAAVLLITIQVILRELYRRSQADIPYRWCRMLAAARWMVIVLVAISIAFTLPPQFGMLIVAMGLVVMAHSIVARRIEDAELLDSLTTAVIAGGGSVPDAFERFAGDRPNSISRRCRDFAYRLRCGIKPAQAAKASRVPLSIDSLLKLEDGRSQPASTTRAPLDDGYSYTSWASWPISNQLTYLALLVFMATVALPLISISTMGVFLTLERMFDEIAMKPEPALEWLTLNQKTISSFSMVLFVIFIGWLVLIAACKLYPARWLMRITPWYSGWVRSRGKYHGLRGVAAGLRSGRSLVDATDATARLTTSRWTARCARSAKQRLQAGQSLATAMQRSGWVNAAESKWIAAAEATGNLSAALETIADSSKRRFELLWRIRLSWMIPLAVLGLGLLVFLVVYAVLGSLTGFIEHLA